MTVRYGAGNIACALAVVLGTGAASACLDKATMCPGGVICPVGSECAADQNVCIPVGGCGNGRLDAGELCDDGNITGGDGCSASCQIELVAGGAHTCALRGDRVRCWGLGSSGQLGMGISVSIGDDEPGLLDGVYVGGAVAQVAAGEWHTCALLSSGSVRCWGAGGGGMLGYGDSEEFGDEDIGDNEVPAAAGDVDVGGAVAHLALGQWHSCALLSSGSVRCWGKSDYYGQLGYGNTVRFGDDEPPSAAGDVPVGGRVTQLVVGWQHTCALLDTGAVRCWGENEFGQLGYGNTDSVGDDEYPADMDDVAVGGTVVQLAAGGSHTCALLDTQKVRCWGSSNSGQLGYGNKHAIGDDELPLSAGDVDVGNLVRQVVTGDQHTCALLVSGAVRCWGENEFGQLGYGHENTIGDDQGPASAGDVDVGGAVTELVAGGDHTCALLSSSSLRCWGRGGNYQLGYGTKESVGDDESPSSVGDVEVGGRVAQVAAGDNHTCALLESGWVRCWGEGDVAGELGYGNRDPVSQPDIFGFQLDGGFRQVAAGLRHTCALAATGAVYCWGDGSSGQLGSGTRLRIGDDEPVAAADVQLGEAAVQIAAGHEHSCALLASGRVRCWGRGQYGQLGYGTRSNVGDNERPDTAGDVELSAAAVQVVTGRAHTCALLASGQVRCWGSNAYGQLGLGPSDDSIGDDELPVAVGPVPVHGPAVHLAAGGSHTCALLADRTVRCWGAGEYGQLGYASDDSIGDASAAGPVAVGGPVVQLTAGEHHTCALLETGAVRCWGLGLEGRLGHGDCGEFCDNIGDDEHPRDAGDIELGGPAMAISAGGAHTCAMLGADRYRCWGSGADGRLGYGDTATVGDNEAPASAGDVPFE